METVTNETVTQVIEVTTNPEYLYHLQLIADHVGMSAGFLQVICGILVFFAVVTLCYFAYKFFRIFF